jgi:hypothetical protein
MEYLEEPYAEMKTHLHKYGYRCDSDWYDDMAEWLPENDEAGHQDNPLIPFECYNGHEYNLDLHNLMKITECEQCKETNNVLIKFSLLDELKQVDLFNKICLYASNNNFKFDMSFSDFYQYLINVDKYEFARSCIYSQLDMRCSVGHKHLFYFHDFYKKLQNDPDAYLEIDTCYSCKNPGSGQSINLMALIGYGAQDVYLRQDKS